MEEKEKQKLKEIMDYVAKKINFHCSKYPELSDCNECEENEGCNKETITWNCDGKLTYFEEALVELEIPSAMQKKLRQYILENGGFCDCEILFNVMN
ncbi:MAG: DUF2695 domain-containing protein [Promethearchaeota archaeon]